MRAGRNAFSNPRATASWVTGHPRLWSTSNTCKAVTAFFTWCSPKKGVRRDKVPQQVPATVNAVPARERSPSSTWARSGRYSSAWRS